MVAADSRSIFYLVMIFFAAAYFITEYLLNLCMENASLQNIRQFFNTHKWVLISYFIAVLCRVPLPFTASAAGISGRILLPADSRNTSF